MSAETGAAAAVEKAADATQTAATATATAAETATGEDEERWTTINGTLTSIAESLGRLEKRIPEPTPSNPATPDGTTSPPPSGERAPAAASGEKQPPAATIKVQAQEQPPKPKSKAAGAKRFGFKRKPSQP